MTGVRILDPREASDEMLDRVHELLGELHAETNAREPYRSPADTRAFLRYPPASQPTSCWLVESGQAVVGFARLVVVEGSPVCYGFVGVAAAARRQGIGSALVEAVRARGREAGGESLVGWHATPAGAGFAARLGATETRRDIRSLLSLPDADLHAEPVAGYELRTWVGAAPESLVASYARAREAINDAPRTSDDEWAPWDVARVRDQERALEQRDGEVRVTVAVDAESRVVSFTELRVSRTSGAVANTEDTAVVPGHRGNGLARWVKAESLRRLTRDRPDVALVGTTNAEGTRSSAT